MEFDVAGAGSVLVGLTAAELRENGLTFETLDYGNAATRALVARLLRKAAEETGALLLPEAPLRIDVLPRTDGGCLFLFSRQTQDLSAPKDCAFFSDDIFAMIDAARACRTQGFALGGALFQNDRGLILLQRLCTASQRRVLSEFLRPLASDPLERVRLEETAQCLIEKNALKVLCGGGA